MGRRKKKEEKIEYIDTDIIVQTEDAIKQHQFDIDNDPELSLNVDPLNKYNMTEEQKQFIHLYCEFKSLPFVQATMNIPTEIANAYFISYSSQKEIRRINRAMLQRRFQTKMMTINEIGGYLSTLITDENVPLSEQLKPREKLSAAGMLIELNKLKAQAIQDSKIIDYKDVEETAKNMSIDAIRALLSNKPNENVNSEKDTLISKLNTDNSLLPEEIDYLKSLSTVELMQLLNTISKK